MFPISTSHKKFEYQILCGDHKKIQRGPEVELELYERDSLSVTLVLISIDIIMVKTINYIWPYSSVDKSILLGEESVHT